MSVDDEWRAFRSCFGFFNFCSPFDSSFDFCLPFDFFDFYNKIIKKNLSTFRHALAANGFCHRTMIVTVWNNYSLTVAFYKDHTLRRQSVLRVISSSALATWQDKGPVHNGGSAVHWPFSVAGGIPTLYRTPGLCHVSPLQRRWRDAGAPGLPVPSTRPGSEADMVWPQSIYATTTRVELSGADWGADPPAPSRPGMRESKYSATLLTWNVAIHLATHCTHSTPLVLSWINIAEHLTHSQLIKSTCDYQATLSYTRYTKMCFPAWQ